VTDAELVDALAATLASRKAILPSSKNEWDENPLVRLAVERVEDVRASATDVASAFGINNPVRIWEVIGMAVTRRVDPGAFAVNPRIPFCIADDVVAVVDQDVMPDPGFHHGPQ
jgi:hypothetical protein